MQSTTKPTTISTQRNGSEDGCGRIGSSTLTTRPTTTGCVTVPSPGRRPRNQASSTRTTPTTVLTIQKATPVVSEMPLMNIE